jgi:hypothetical protein
MHIPGAVPYMLAFSAVVIDAAEDLFWIAAAATAGARSMVGITGFRLGQDTLETSEQLPIELFRTATDNSAAGSALTGVPPQFGLPSQRFTARVGPMTAATRTQPILRLPENILNGWLWQASTPEEIIWVVGDTNTAQHARAAIGFPTAPSAAINVSGVVNVLEVRW